MSRMTTAFTCAALLSLFGWVATLLLMGQPAKAQENCENLDEQACARLTLSVRKWNQLYGEAVRVLDWNHEEKLTGDNAEQVIKLMSSPETAWLPRRSEENKIEAVLLGEIPEDELTTWVDDWHKSLVDIVYSMDDVVKIQWAQRDSEFETTAVVGSTYPYVYDNLLAGAAITETAKSCKHHVIRWLWGGIRGEILIDLVAINNFNRQCKRSEMHWMRYGKTDVRLTEVEYSEVECSMNYAFAWATVGASINFNPRLFEFEISGLGSGGGGSADCIEKR